MHGAKTRAAFVSTNSITQGEQVAAVWKPLYDMFSIGIDFAHRTFKWESEASEKAAVHCVIVGFSKMYGGERIIYDGERRTVATNISPYLIDAPNIFIESRRIPICNVPEMQKGNIPVDGGNLIIERDEIDGFLAKEPKAERFIRKLVGSIEFINNIPRYCLWLVDASPSEILKMPEVVKRVELCREMRASSPKAATRKFADYATRFMEIRQPQSRYILVPRHSSERRRYIPFGFMESDVITTDANSTIADATLYHFGILTSNVHMAWVRAVCGRIKSDYRYSNDIVYNNFPWPPASDEQKQKLKGWHRWCLTQEPIIPKVRLQICMAKHLCYIIQPY
jgi:hypothetical protein